MVHCVYVYLFINENRLDVKKTYQIVSITESLINTDINSVMFYVSRQGAGGGGGGRDLGGADTLRPLDTSSMAGQSSGAHPMPGMLSECYYSFLVCK